MVSRRNHISLIYRASRYRLYPTQTRQRQFVHLCGAGRFVHNELLGDQIRGHKRCKAGEGESPAASRFDFSGWYVWLKATESHEWLRELAAPVVCATGEVPATADLAHYPRHLREGGCGKKAGFPRFEVGSKGRESSTIWRWCRKGQAALGAESWLTPDEPQGGSCPPCSCYSNASNWSRTHRAVGEAEYLDRGEDPRFVVTSLSVAELPAQTLYEELYARARTWSTASRSNR